MQLVSTGSVYGFVTPGLEALFLAQFTHDVKTIWMRISVAQAHVLFLIKKFDVSNGPSAIFSLCHDDVKTASSLQEKRTLKSRKKKKTAILFGTDVHLNNIIYLLLIMSHFVQVPLL